MGLGASKYRVALSVHAQVMARAVTSGQGGCSLSEEMERFLVEGR
jgi:hypothetical protein